MAPVRFDSGDIEDISRTIRARGGRRFLAPLSLPHEILQDNFISEFSSTVSKTICLTLNTEESSHALRSLRLEKNDLVSIFDSEKQIEGIGRISEQSKGTQCTVDLFHFQRLPAPKNILLVGLAKPQVNELIVEKGTEIGARAIYFYQGEFSSLRSLSTEEFKKKTTRLIKTRDSALKQSYAHWAPEIKIFPSLETGILEIMHDFPTSTRFAGDPYASKASLPTLMGQVTRDDISIFATGSEGGFSPKEYDFLDKKLFQRVSLGPGVLRVETAAILGLGLLALYRD